MNTVALLAIILGPAVAALGIAFGYLISRGEQKHGLSLARGQQAHERQLRRGERFFEKRAEVYESLLAIAFRSVSRIALTEPIMSFEGQPDPPAPPTEDEWLSMQVRLAAYGSPEVAEAFERFTGTWRGFNYAVSTLRLKRQQRAADLAENWKEVQGYRDQAVATLEEIKSLVRTDLAEL